MVLLWEPYGPHTEDTDMKVERIRIMLSSTKVEWTRMTMVLFSTAVFLLLLLFSTRLQELSQEIHFLDN